VPRPPQRMKARTAPLGISRLSSRFFLIVEKEE
jgi:hypothetical protein